MKISTEIGSISRYVGEERAVEYVAKAGFDCWDFSMFNVFNCDWQNGRAYLTDHQLAGPNYLSFVKTLKRIGEDNGIHCNQSHTPFPNYWQEVLDFQKRAIECSAIAGAKVCVIHPDNFKSAEENAEMYLKLLEYAHEFNINIATENMWDWDYGKNIALPSACSDEKDFLAHIRAVDDNLFCACLDIGHAEMKGLNTSAVKMIYALNENLKALHIHDNDKWHDSHALPYTMDIEFKPILKALKDINYSGDFTLEADTFIKTYQEDVFGGVKKMAQSAKMLVKEYEEL